MNVTNINCVSRSRERAMRMIQSVWIVTLSLLLGCAALPARPQAPYLTVPYPINDVQRAAADAVTVYGFQLNSSNASKREETELRYLEGTRPRTQGVSCSPGGETILVWLEQYRSEVTRIWIHTAIASFGAACQRNWNQNVIEELQKALQDSKYVH